MAELPHMPLATDAYLADTTHLTTQEHGAYLLLLITAWRVRGRPCLPDDDKLLARYAKLDPRTWKTLKPTIMGFWQLGDDGFWTQKKQQEVREMTNKRVEVARNKAAKRWGAKALENNNTEDAGALLNECTADATKTKPTIVGKKEPNGSMSETVVSDVPVPSRKRKPYPPEFEQSWRAYPTDQLMSKAKGFAAWAKLDVEDHGRVFASIPAFVAYCRKHPDYRPVHMVRYITDRRFDGFMADAGEPATGPDWPKRLAYARANRRWSSSEWGPLPGMTGCAVPDELIQPGDGDGWSEWTRGAAA